MDPILNPFSPGAGAPPPELVGRTQIIDQAKVLLGRVRQGRPEKSFLLIGLRGVGKTVLLNEIDRLAQAADFRSIMVEAREDKRLPILLGPPLKKLLFDLDRHASAGDKARQALRVLKSFVSAVRVGIGGVDIGLDLDPEQGVADSGDLEADLPELFSAVAEAAQEKGAAVVLLIDEVQYLDESELSALIMAMHRMQQRKLPLALVGAGLPILPGLAGESKSYVERLFGFPEIGPLPKEDADRALREPLEQAGVKIDQSALDEVHQLAQGYPYFIQEWGYQIWNGTPSSPIRPKHVKEATSKVIARLDQNFFRVRFDRLTQSEKQFLRAMAELGPGPHRIGDVADTLLMKTTSLGPVRASLIKKGMIFSPSHGLIGFTVPLFDDFMRRAIPNFEA